MCGETHQLAEQTTRPHKRQEEEEKLGKGMPYELAIEKLERYVAVHSPLGIGETHAEQTVSHGSVLAVAEEDGKVGQDGSSPYPLRKVGERPQPAPDVVRGHLRVVHVRHARLELGSQIWEEDGKDRVEGELQLGEWLVASSGLKTASVSPLVAVLEVLEHGSIAGAAVPDAVFEEDELEKKHELRLEVSGKRGLDGTESFLYGLEEHFRQLAIEELGI